MAFKHLTQHLLEELMGARDAPSSQLFQQLLHHIVELCPECKQEYDAACEAMQLHYRDRYSQEVATIVARLLRHGVNFTKLRAEADEEFRRLRRFEPAERTVRISRAVSRFRSPFLVDTLLKHCQALLTTDPFEAGEWAECAHAVALRVPQDRFGSSWAMTVLARAKAHRGNALRVQGAYLRASPLLEAALALFRSEGDGDPLVLAELVTLLATLRMDQRQHDEAEALLNTAEELYIEVDDPVLRGRVLLKRANLVSDMGRGQEAIEIARGVMADFSCHGHERLYLFSVQSLVHHLRDAERLAEARDLLAAHADRFRRLGEPLFNLRVAWLTATVAHGLGQIEAAASSLESIRQRFLVEGLTFDAALAGLDLSLVFLDQGRAHEIRRLADEIVPVFLTQEVGREAIATVMLFQEAARRQSVTRRMVHELVRALGRRR